MQIPEEQDGLDQGFNLDGFTGLLDRLRESKDRHSITAALKPS